MSVSSVSVQSPASGVLPQQLTGPARPTASGVEHHQPPSPPTRPVQTAATGGRGTKVDITV